MKRVLSSARRRVLAWLRERGISVARVRRSERWPRDPYAPSATCQIPDLAHLYRLFFGPPSAAGSYVEVGAYDGYTYSNTWQLAHLGWSGLLIEPVPSNYRRCCETYRGFGNIKVEQIAVGAANGTIELNVAGAYSSGSPETVAAHDRLDHARSERVGSTIVVETRVLRNLCPVAPDLLVVDVEGLEPEVFAGVDLTSWRPKMMIVELTDCHPHYPDRQRPSRLLAHLLDHDYVVVWRDLTNSVLVCRRHYENITNSY